MQVQTYDLDGPAETVAELYSDEEAQLWPDGAPVLAVTRLNARVPLGMCSMGLLSFKPDASW